MNNQKIKLPEKKVFAAYLNKRSTVGYVLQTEPTTSQGDPTNHCTSILTTTHFLAK